MTIGIGSIILYNLRLRKLKTHNFYYFWSGGFILYGVQIAIRDFIGTTFGGTVLVITAFSLFLGGIWSLNRSKPLMFLTFFIYFISLVMSYLILEVHIIDFTEGFYGLFHG